MVTTLALKLLVSKFSAETLATKAEIDLETVIKAMSGKEMPIDAKLAIAKTLGWSVEKVFPRYWAGSQSCLLYLPKYAQNYTIYI